MVNLPADWHYKNGNSNGINERIDMNNKINDTERSFIKPRVDSPIISVPEIKPLKIISLTKGFKDGVDNDIKIRNSQLSDSYFKCMPKLVTIKESEITTHYIPGFTTVADDLNTRPRVFEKIHKKNEFGFDRTGVKEIKINKVNPEDVTNKVEQKNKFNLVGFEPRELGGQTPIVPVQQQRKKILIKH